MNWYLVWLGNDRLNAITESQVTYDLRIDMWDNTGFHQHSEFRNFKLGNAHTRYQFMHKGYIDGFAGEGGLLNGLEFKTNAECPHLDGGWWYDPGDTSCVGPTLTGENRRWKMRAGLLFNVSQVVARIRPNHIVPRELFLIRVS
jgi:hypothetical protein